MSRRATQSMARTSRYARNLIEISACMKHQFQNWSPIDGVSTAHTHTRTHLSQYCPMAERE